MKTKNGLTQTCSSIFTTAVVLFLTLFFSKSGLASSPLPELFCGINENGQSLACQYKDKRDSSKTFSDDDIGAFIEKTSSGGYITVKSKRGFERTFEVDPDSSEFKKLKEVKKTASASDIARQKLDLFSDIERKAIQISDGLDTIFIQSDLLKYDPAVAFDKCKLDMGVNSSAAFEQNLDNLKTENKALSAILTNLIKSFKGPSSCLADYKIEVGPDGSVDLMQLQGLAQAFHNRCKRKL